MNTTNLIGHISDDPFFIPKTEEKSAVAFFSIANNDDKTPVFVAITAFGKTAEYVNSKLKKGARVAIEGKLAQRTKKTKNGDTYRELYVVCKRLTNLSKNGVNEA